ncbi:DUF2334 domain-containing protein [Natronomonas marina]|uniref:DUF2334 domain-containing protein n=1 Tax=Natronomonas marina TaxID=2961939 RepID=UPI0020C9D665|nr:polysaccharide deacetylase family protein [Natronomonas marina]
MDEDRGVFTLSLDTELAWGTFDVERVERYEAAYRRTPEVIDRLCALLDEYRIPATWAVVSHLLVDCDGDHGDRNPPSLPGVDDWFGSLPCSSGLDRELWSAPWLVDRIRSCETDQEIGLHGATHMQLGAEGCSRQNAVEELEAAVETLEGFGVSPESFVFPRNDVGHLDVLAEYGIRVYRGVDARWYEHPPTPEAVKPPLRFVDEATRRTPPVVEPRSAGDLVNLPGSQPFRPRRGGWKYTPPGSSVARAKRGLRRAARTGKVFHLWFHPFNLAGDPDAELRRFERVLETARELVSDGRLVVRPMEEVASMKF